MISIMTLVFIWVAWFVGGLTSAVWAGSPRGSDDTRKGKTVKVMIRGSKKKEAARMLNSEEYIV
jgi:hypothetical protein